MVAELLRLKIALLRNSLRRSAWQLVGIIIGALYGLGVLAGIIAGLVALSFASAETASTVIVLAGSAVVLGWMLIPLLASGIDMTLDPARFVTFAVPMNKLLVGLALSGVVGIPGLVTLIASLATAATWWKHPASVLAALVCAILAVFTCIALSRLVTSATTSLSSSRRFKDISGVIAFIPLLLLGPIFASVSTGIANAQEFLPELARTLSWTPLGAVWAVPGDLATGTYAPAAAKFAIAVLTLATVLWLWRVSLARALVTPAHSAVSRKSAGNLGFFARFPGTATGAVAARALTYWFRDPRYGGSLIVIPILPFILWFAFGQGESLAVLNIVGPITAFLLAWSISADISYDNTAFSLHVATGVSGFADRAGRAIACAVLGLPVSVAFVLVPVWITDAWTQLPALLGVTLGIFLSGLGLASVVSARFTYNVPAPGESPFKTPPGSGMQMLIVQMVGWAVLIVLSLPEVILAILAFTTGSASFGWLALAVGLVLGSALVVLGIRMGGRWYDQRTPELLLAVGANK